MLYIRKESKKEPVWAVYSEGTEFLIKPLTAEILGELKKPYAKKTLGTSSGSRDVEVKEIVDDDKFSDAIIDYVIEDWKGVCDENEEPLPCTFENKKAAMDIADISDFVFSFARKIPVMSAKKLEEELGN